MENFAKEFFGQAKSEREVFVLSSGECVTATRVVHKQCAVRKSREPACVAAFGRAPRAWVKGRASANFFPARLRVSTCRIHVRLTKEKVVVGYKNFRRPNFSSKSAMEGFLLTPQGRLGASALRDDRRGELPHLGCVIYTHCLPLGH